MDKRYLVIGVGLGLMLACMVLAPAYLIIRGQTTEEMRGLRIQLHNEQSQSPSPSASSPAVSPAGLGNYSQSPSAKPSVSPSQSSASATPAVSQTPEVSSSPSQSPSSSPTTATSPSSSLSSGTTGQTAETDNDSAQDSDDKDEDSVVDDDKTKSVDSGETDNSDNEKYLAEQRRRYNHYNSLEPENGNAHVYIMPGMTALQVSRLLEERGVVDDAQSFLDYLKEWGYTPKIASGYYLLPQQSTYSAAYNQIRTR